MVDLGEIKLFLGIRIERTADKIMLDQSVYLKNILRKFHMDEAHPVSTPLEIKIDYSALHQTIKGDKPVQSLIGCLMYAMLCTRPDLSYSVNLLSRFQTKNNPLVWQMLKRILRYVKGTVYLKLFFEKENTDKTVIGYADASFADDEVTRRSTTGFLFKLYDSCLITWGTRHKSTTLRYHIKYGIGIFGTI